MENNKSDFNEPDNYQAELEAKMQFWDAQAETEAIKEQTAREKLQYKTEFAVKAFTEAGYNDSVTDALKALIQADSITDTNKAAKRLTDSIERRYRREKRSTESKHQATDDKDPFIQGFKENPYGSTAEEYEKTFRKAVGLPAKTGGK